MIDLLKLRAEDQDGLMVISAAMQDAIVKVGSLYFDQDAQSFFLYALRYTHEDEHKLRRHTGLKLFNVLGVQYRNIDRTDPKAFMVLLSMDTLNENKDGPDTLDLVFAGDGVIRLTIDAVDLAMVDSDQGRYTKNNPIHADV